MTKSNDRRHQPSGIINSGNIIFPDPLRNQNSPTDGSNNFSDKARIGRNSQENNKY